MDGVGVLWDRLNAVLAPVVSALPGWHWWDEPPDATAVPAGWVEWAPGARGNGDDQSLYVASFRIVGAVDHQPSKPTTAAEVAFLDSVVWALVPGPATLLHPVSVSWEPGEVDIGSMTHRAALVSVSLVYSIC